MLVQVLVQVLTSFSVYRTFHNLNELERLFFAGGGGFIHVYVFSVIILSLSFLFLSPPPPPQTCPTCSVGGL